MGACWLWVWWRKTLFSCQKVSIKFWKLSGYLRSLPRPDGGVPDHISADHIFMKCLLEMCFGKKVLLNFGNHMEITDLCQGPTVHYLIS